MWDDIDAFEAKFKRHNKWQNKKKNINRKRKNKMVIVKWECEVCESINKHAGLFCIMCGNSKNLNDTENIEDKIDEKDDIKINGNVNDNDLNDGYITPTEQLIQKNINELSLSPKTTGKSTKLNATILQLGVNNSNNNNNNTGISFDSNTSTPVDNLLTQGSVMANTVFKDLGSVRRVLCDAGIKGKLAYKLAGIMFRQGVYNDKQLLKMHPLFLKQLLGGIKVLKCGDKSTIFNAIQKLQKKLHGKLHGK